MGQVTGIAWTRSTRNFWSGCTKVGPGCDGCYAEASSRRMRGLDELTKEAANWGPGRPRIPHLEGADRDLRKWDRMVVRERTMMHQKRPLTTDWPRPGFWPVFLNSYSDFADNEVPQDWQRLMFTTIEECENLHLQLVTKRIGNVEGLLEGRWSEGRMPKNVWLIITAVTQAELDRDGPKLLDLTERLCFPVIGLSMEPQLEEIDTRPFLKRAAEMGQKVWGITGGESTQPGHPARPYDLKWPKVLIYDFEEFDQPLFVKQLGSNVLDHGNPITLKGKADDPTAWPLFLRKQQFPV